jgi:hypothetical protein
MGADAILSFVQLEPANRSQEVCRGFSIRLMRSQQAIYESTQRSVGVTKSPHLQIRRTTQTTIKGFLDPKSITAVFERKGKGKVSYSHRQHTQTEARAAIIQWVSESKRSFNIVSDRGFQCLMKTRRPEIHIPSPSTVSHDVKKVFVNVRKCMAKMLQEHDGNLNFATDTWTSPNHWVFVAVTVHFETNSVLVSLLLDLVEVATSHLGINFAAAFTKVIDKFGISDKVSKLAMM